MKKVYLNVIILIFILLSFFTACSNGAVTNDNGASTTTTLTTYTNEPNFAGMNVWFLNDYDKSNAFVDIMKHSRPWQNADWNADASTDSNFWPTQDCSTVFFAGLPAHYINGTYKLIFEGQADVSIEWTNGSVTNKVYNSETNITSADVAITINAVTDAGKIVFRNTKLTQTSATNTGIKNVRFYKPGYPTDGSQVFTTEFLNAMSGCKVIRFMDWFATNNSSVKTWAERGLPGYAHQSTPNGPLSITYPNPDTYVYTSKGGALEHMIQLANELNSDMWINIPVLADDGYIEKLSLALRYGTDGINPYTAPQTNPVYPPLESNLKVYIEYANEVWNSAPGFMCFHVVYDIVSKLPSNHPIFSDGMTIANDIYQLMWKYPLYRLIEISKILKTQFGDSEMLTRIRPIFSTWQGDGHGSLSIPLTWADKYYRIGQNIQIKDLIYGAGGSAYYGVTTPDTNFDSFFAPTNYPDKNFLRNNAKDSSWAYAYGLKRVAYEGGLGLDIYDSNWNLIFPEESTQLALSADPRMQDIIEKTHIAWSQTGGDELIYYCITGPSQWQIVPDIFDLNSPRMKGLQNIINSNKAEVNLGGAIPGTLIAKEIYPNGNDVIKNSSGWDQIYDDKLTFAGNQAGNIFALRGHSEEAFAGTFKLNGTPHTGTSELEIFINGVYNGTVTLSGSSEHLTDSTEIPVNLPKGFVVIRIDVKSGPFAIYSATISQ